MTTDLKEKPTNVLEDFEKAKNKFNTYDYTQEEFEELANLYTQSFRDVKQGELVKGRLVRIQDDNVIIDVGFKSEGTIPRSEFGEDANLEVGQEVEVVLESVEDLEGNLVLSKSRADFLRIWQKVFTGT